MDFNENRPIYIQVADAILKKIQTGELMPGDKLASVRELAKEYKVNPNTISKSQQELETTGIFETRRGMGVFVVGDGNIIKNTMNLYIKKRVEETRLEYELLGIGIEELIELLEEVKYDDDIKSK
ncbi:MAG: GntR family transcriptional regulator [Firmicutes bacterium]|nr:GntR family transcriptional regulator [Bacillota bacterium]